MGWTISAAGLIVVAVTLRDVFHTLWHPSGFGRISRWTFQLVWCASKHVIPSRTRQLAGPIGVLGTVTLWAGLVVIGWTLVYLPHMPGSFRFDAALSPGGSADPLTALYLSLVTVTTLGYGDVTPAEPALRLLVPLEAFLGFVLLTATISWILQVYPVLGRRRSVAKKLSILQASRSTILMAAEQPCIASRVLDSVTDGLIQAETDLVQYEESYYFLEQDEALSLAATLPYALRLAEGGRASASGEVRLAADMLAMAVESLVVRLDRVYLKTGAATSDVMAAYATDHGFDPKVGRPARGNRR